MAVFCESPPLFPPFVIHVSARSDQGAATDIAEIDPSPPLPAHLRNAVDKRRIDFIVGRRCARRALAGLIGHFTGEIGVGSHNAPLWPADVVGSITHTDGFVSAAVTRASRARAVGIDTERIMSGETVAAVHSLIAAPGERPPPGGSLPDDLFYTILFSAKESVFKCLFPLVGRMFYFDEANVALSAADATFQATLLTDLAADFRAGYTLQGRYVITPPFVHTGIIVAGDHRPGS